MWPFSTRETKSSISRAEVQGLPPVRWSERNARTFASEGYERCVIVARCVQIVSRSIASIPVCVEINKKEVENHPLLALLEKPNPTMGRLSFIERAMSFHQITGQSFIECLKAGGTPKELWVWEPYSMKVLEPKKGMIPLGYQFDNGNPQQKRTWDVDAINGFGDMLHFKTFNPLDMWYGLSPIANAAYAADQHNEANVWNMRMLKNVAVPSGAVVNKQELTENQFSRFKKELDETYSGANNARRPMVLSGELSWVPMSLSPLEMDWLNGKNLSAREIAAAFGVPTQVIPIQGDQTFANYEQARLALWQDTVIPLAKTFYSDLSRWFSGMYGEEICLELELDEVPALEPARKQKWDMVSSSTFLTTNEKREAVGYEPIKDTPMADKVLISGAQTAMPTAAEQEIMDQQAAEMTEEPVKPEDLKTSVKRQLKAIGL